MMWTHISFQMSWKEFVKACLAPSLCLDSSGNICTMHEHKNNKTCSGTRLHDEIMPITERHV